jgi:acetolactate synthase I/II/III large subunit
MRGRKGSDLFVECLEAEGVQCVFGIPGEETLDLNESLSRSSIAFVPVRHEQGGAYMADMLGRLTGRAGVCLSTLGPGAANLVTAAADAFLDRVPLVLLTGQTDLGQMHKESHQYVDVISLMRPITKWNARVTEPEIIPEVVRKAFKLAETNKPGPTHIELPEDVMAAPARGRPLKRTEPARSEAPEREVFRAAGLIREARNPVALAGNGVVRGGATAALREFARQTSIPVAETFMGKGLMHPHDPRSLGPVGLQTGDYQMAGFGEADLVIAIGYDLVEHAPRNWNPNRDKKIVCIDSLPAEIDEYFIPQVELVGDVYHAISRLGEECRDITRPGGSTRLRDAVHRRFEQAVFDPDVPLRPPRVLYEIRRLLAPSDILVSDVGLHKLWIGRMYPAYEPNTALITNGLAGMGFAIPAAIGAKLVHPERKVVSVSGDGGALMNFQELETAVRLKAAVVNIVWEDGTFGAVARTQERKFGRHFGTDLGYTDFVQLAKAFGMPGWRCESAPDFAERLKEALGLEVPSLIVVPIDYSIDLSTVANLDQEMDT